MRRPALKTAATFSVPKKRPRLPSRQDGHVIRLFSANDYLGLSAHPMVREAASRAALAVGNGPRASALVSGYTHEHRALETTLAALKGSEECLLFPTGAAAAAAETSAALPCASCCSPVDTPCCSLLRS